MRNKVELTSKGEAQKLRYRASHYVLIGDVLYKQDHSLLLLRCLDQEEANYVLRKSMKEYMVITLWVSP